MEYVRKTIKDDEEFLRQKSTDVDLQNDNYMEWIIALKNYCCSHTVYAMAPVQIGIPKRLIYIKNTNSDMSRNDDSSYDEEVILINPRIISANGHTRFLEGCESCLNFRGIVDRPYSVNVEYYTPDKVKHIDTFEGFKATVFCHEYDHLNGILHMDRAIQIFEKTLEETRKYREEHPYEIISKDDEFIFDEEINHKRTK